ncbi:MAG: aminodeoxychorismate synthase component I [Clostridia bacterium]
MAISKTALFQYFGRKKYAAILESSLQSEENGRKTIVAFDPFLVFSVKDKTNTICSNGSTKIVVGNPFEILRDLVRQNKHRQRICPEFAGCIGFFGYEMLQYIEEIPMQKFDDDSYEDMIVCFYDNGIVLEGENLSFSNEYAKSEYEKSSSAKFFQRHRPDFPTELISNFTKQEYISAVERAKHYIYEGDIFQVNLSQRFQTKFHEAPIEVFIRLCNTSPAPFAAYLNFDEVEIISNSPERFLKIEGDTIETKPIKGTIARGSNEMEDRENRNQLIASKKDHAELTMIVDLARNDIGRICRFGSVEVAKHHEIEPYANVFHTVSTVCGTLKKDCDFVDAMYAMFPGGSITGAPKVRAMQLIDELEPCKRGVYTGAIGYLGFDGYADFNIAIRTIAFKNGIASFSVGGGIVWDSDPEAEYQETLAKGKMIAELLAFGLIETFLVNEDGIALHLDAHLLRLKNSMGYFGLTGKEKIKSKLKEFLEKTHIRNKIVRMKVTHHDITFSVRDNPYTKERKTRGYRMTVSPHVIDEQDILLRHKTTRNLAKQNELLRANQLGFDDVLFLNSKGNLVETAKCNIFIQKNGVLYTPHIDSGILPGVMRAFEIQNSRQINKVVIETEIPFQELLSADEVFVTNSPMGKVLAMEIDGLILHQNNLN